jgi:protein-tyrosine phosphatase
MGNICRSPTAEGVFRKFVDDAGLAEQIHIESAGTHAYHLGEPPDRRAQEAARRRGYELSAIRARRVAADDFAGFDYIIAMDKLNLVTLREYQAGRTRATMRLFLEFAEQGERDVPDPYYGGATGFERVLDLVEDASRGLLAYIRKQDRHRGA